LPLDPNDPVKLAIEESTPFVRGTNTSYLKPKVANPNGTEPAEIIQRDNAEPFALPLAEFIAAESDAPPALVGTDEDCLLPAHGLVILGGKSGKGKTTLVIDAAFHLASGREWLRFAVARPLRVLMIENEGPREPFRRKLERKAKTWPHEITGGIYVHAAHWGRMTFRAGPESEALRDYIAEHEIDLIIGDPLGSLGVDGVGSPAETRDFVLLLKELGLFDRVAFLLLHHFRKEPTNDEIDDLSGAWASHTDTILVLKMQAGNRSRLSFPKLRWGLKRAPEILAFDPETESFEYVGEEIGERDLVAEICELMESESKWRTPTEIVEPKSKGGIGAHRDAVVKTLEDSELFVSADGADVGRPKAAICWNLRNGQDSQGELV